MGQAGRKQTGEASSSFSSSSSSSVRFGRARRKGTRVACVSITFYSFSLSLSLFGGRGRSVAREKDFFSTRLDDEFSTSVGIGAVLKREWKGVEGIGEWSECLIVGGVNKKKESAAVEEGRRAIPPRVGGFPGCPGSVGRLTW